MNDAGSMIERRFDRMEPVQKGCEESI